MYKQNTNSCIFIFLLCSKHQQISHYQNISVIGETPRNLVLRIDTVKNYRSMSLLDCKHNLSLLSSNGKRKARVARAGVVKAGWPEARWPKEVARGQVVTDPLARGQVARGPLCGTKSQGRESFVLRTYIVGGVGVRKLHFD